MSVDRLDHLTYEIRHNPNCPSPFLIVTCGDAGVIGRQGNLFSYGKTLNEAVTAALKAIDDHQNHRGQSWVSIRQNPPKANYPEPLAMSQIHPIPTSWKSG